MGRVGFLAMLVAGLGACGCAFPPPTGPSPTGAYAPRPQEAANFVLYVSNQSTLDRLPMSIYVDDVLVVRGHFWHLPNLRKHFPDPIDLRLAPGDHQLRAVASPPPGLQLACMAEASIVVHVRASGMTWCSVTYDYSPGGRYGTKTHPAITIHERNEPFDFC